MVNCLIIPTDSEAPLRIEDFEGFSDFQQLVGGWPEPIDVPHFGITLYVNQETSDDGTLCNGRATALAWYFHADESAERCIYGDVAVTGIDDGNMGIDVSEFVIRALTLPRGHTVQVASSINPNQWSDCSKLYDNFFDAAYRCFIWARCSDGGHSYRVHRLAAREMPFPIPPEGDMLF